MLKAFNPICIKDTEWSNQDRKGFEKIQVRFKFRTHNGAFFFLNLQKDFICVIKKVIQNLHHLKKLGCWADVTKVLFFLISSNSLQLKFLISPWFYWKVLKQKLPHFLWVKQYLINKVCKDRSHHLGRCHPDVIISGNILLWLIFPEVTFDLVYPNISQIILKWNGSTIKLEKLSQNRFHLSL